MWHFATQAYLLTQLRGAENVHVNKPHGKNSQILWKLRLAWTISNVTLRLHRAPLRKHCWTTHFSYFSRIIPSNWHKSGKNTDPGNQPVSDVDWCIGLWQHWSNFSSCLCSANALSSCPVELTDSQLRASNAHFRPVLFQQLNTDYIQ